jgi:Domain of unknown function (DUF4190)
MEAPDGPGRLRIGRASLTAKAALACGILGFAVPLLPVGAIFLGHMAMREIRRSGGQGIGIAKAGLTLGYAALVLSLVLPLLVGWVGFHRGLG